MKIECGDIDPIHAIVPLKALRKSKTRLSSILQPKERAGLTVAMLEDVLSALRESSMIDSITVVSADGNVLRLVRQFGANSQREGRRPGLNSAISQVIRKRKLGNSAVLVVHADLPLLTSKEVRTFVREARSFPITVAPSKDESGTNALLLNPAQIIRPAFGKNSYRRYLSIVDQRKLRFKVQRVQGFGFDIDEPKDLLELMHERTRNNTAKFLQSIRDRTFQKAT